MREGCGRIVRIGTSLDPFKTCRIGSLGEGDDEW